MELHVEIAILCIINLVWIQHTLCDGLSTKYETNKWTCTCSIAHQENLNFAPANCSLSCDCSPGRSSENRWTCICPTDGLPKVVGEDNDSSCFTACNCNAGTLTELQPPKKWISSKIVLIILVLCVILTVLAFIASVLWYVYRKVKHPVRWPSFSSDRLTSCGNATNLISQDASSVPVYKGYLDSSTSFLFRTTTGAIQGTIVQFSYSELQSATNSFSDTNLIGVGGSSHVYRGNLRDGSTVAIKRMKTQGGPDAETAFLTEIELISRLHHFHVVPLLGYCLEYQGNHAERLLVFEYIPNGNLRECLDGDLGQCLEWNTRVAIALGAARGLEYLHEAAEPKILHRDVKSSNILLDDKWRAKITDLGMAKHLHNDGVLSCSSSPAGLQGSFGYFAPEHAIVGRASVKSDVFSFGVVLLELITGRKPIHKSSNKGEESLVIWATPRLHDNKRLILELPDPRLKGTYQEEEMQVMAYLARECLLLDPNSRPSMSEVVQILSTIAPDSKRKNMPLNAFKYSSTDGSRRGMPEMCDGELYDTAAMEEIKQITSEMPARCSLPSNPAGRNICDIEIENEADNPSTDVAKPALLTSKSTSMVGLTEPQLESFRLPNLDSHIVQ
ncbi:hypothetical protein Pfo_018081 [Paulownia fortunei]|nr:hypothetical protein Pfo_018081 [Paulownia fortunei]